MRGMKVARHIPCELNLDGILRPANAFSHPNEVVCDPDLTINEKRAILASWASDACAVESMPELRKAPAGATVTFDEIMDALKELDQQARQGLQKSPPYRKWFRHSDLLS